MIKTHAAPLSSEDARAALKTAEACARSAAEQIADVEAQLAERAARYPISAAAQDPFVETFSKKAALIDLLARVNAALPGLRLAVRDAEAFEKAAPARRKAEAKAVRRAELAAHPLNAETLLREMMAEARVERNAYPGNADLLITTDMLAERLIDGVERGSEGEPFALIVNEAAARKFFKDNLSTFALPHWSQTLEQLRIARRGVVVYRAHAPDENRMGPGLRW